MGLHIEYSNHKTEPRQFLPTILTPDDDQYQLKHVVQGTETFK
jgi:hypothetical protein